MNIFFKMLAAVSFVFIISGCVTASKLGELPSNPVDYTKDKAYLLKRFPEIEKYEPRVVEQESYDCWTYDCLLVPLFDEPELKKVTVDPDLDGYPLKEDVLKVLGKPNFIKGSYTSNFIMSGIFLLIQPEEIFLALTFPFVFRPEPTQYYYFIRGNYCIETRFERRPGTMYKSLMTSWQWFEDTKKCNNL